MFSKHYFSSSCLPTSTTAGITSLLTETTQLYFLRQRGQPMKIPEGKKFFSSDFVFAFKYYLGNSKPALESVYRPFESLFQIGR